MRRSFERRNFLGTLGTLLSDGFLAKHLRPAGGVLAAVSDGIESGHVADCGHVAVSNVALTLELIEKPRGRHPTRQCPPTKALVMDAFQLKQPRLDSFQLELGCPQPQ